MLERAEPRHRLRASLALAALGIVFGDIGTSPLYAFRQCFVSLLKIAPTHENVLGILSLILWSLILIVFVRYIGMVMRVSHDGEGGILALLAFVLPPVRRGVPPAATWLTFLVILGAGMLFGDGVITPAVSVLSSVEGLSVATADAQPFVMPLAVVILASLFLVQSRGTHRIGAVFGPIMLTWFITIAVLGILGIAKDPAALWALNPIHIVRFFCASWVRRDCDLRRHRTLRFRRRSTVCRYVPLRPRADRVSVDNRGFSGARFELYRSRCARAFRT